MALFPNMYQPLLSPDLYGGGPAMVDFLPDAEPMAPAPAPMTPQEEFLARIQQAEQMVPGVLPAAPAIAAPAAPTGFQFMTDRGRQAGFGANTSGFIAADPNAQYRMFDERGKNRVVAEGTGVDALQNIYNLANQFNTEQGKKANWGIERLNPETGKWERVAENDPAKNIAGKIADVALPIAVSFIPGVGPVLGAALGSAASSVAQGRSLKDTLMRAGLSAGGAFAGGQLLGGVGGGGASSTSGLLATGGVLPTVGGGFSATLGGAAGSAAGNLAGQAVIDAAGNMTLPVAARSALGSATGSALGAGAGSLLGSAAVGAPSPAPTDTQGEPITVTADPVSAAQTQAATAAAVANNLLPTGGILPSGQTPTKGETTLETGNSLLDDIIKYYSLGSAGLDALGGALGGGGAGGQMAPYTSRLGPAPSFARGAFTPFAGDYETYGFGPEFNFFGGAPAPTPAAPAFGLLPPAAMPGSGTV